MTSTEILNLESNFKGKKDMMVVENLRHLSKRDVSARMIRNYRPEEH